MRASPSAANPFFHVGSHGFLFSFYSHAPFSSLLLLSLLCSTNALPSFSIHEQLNDLFLDTERNLCIHHNRNYAKNTSDTSYVAHSCISTRMDQETEGRNNYISHHQHSHLKRVLHGEGTRDGKNNPKKEESCFELLSSLLFYYDLEREESTQVTDLEITMILVSSVVTMGYLGIHLFHMKRQINVLSRVSALVLVILILGLTNFLVLNFRVPLVKVLNGQYLLLENDGYFEVNSTVRMVVALVAFLLPFRHHDHQHHLPWRVTLQWL